MAKASDGQGTDSATETVTINGLNDNPTAASDSNGVAIGAVISDGHGDMVTLLGVKAAQLHNHDFDLV
jgi:hypothetical protein